MANKGRGRPFAPKYSIEEVEKFASRALSVREIAHNIGVKATLLQKHVETKPEVAEAVERGRARSSAMCANVILTAARALTKPELQKLKANNQELPTITPQHIKASLEYLNRHADLWKPQQQALTQIEINQVNNDAINQLSDETKERAAWAFLKLRGLLPPGVEQPNNVTRLKKSG